jgi:enhancing lycopene biosynthesis protein 2
MSATDVKPQVRDMDAAQVALMIALLQTTGFARAKTLPSEDFADKAANAEVSGRPPHGTERE